MNNNERKETSKEIIDRYIGALEDDLQHYTMVDKDSVKAKLIEFELKEYKQIKQDLEILEIIKKHLIISGLSITCFISGNPSCKEVYEKRFEEIKRWLKSE